MKTLHVCLATLCLTTACGATEFEDSALPTSAIQDELIVLRSCIPTAPANATLNPGAAPSATIGSGFFAYGSQSCPYYIVDVNVSSAAYTNYPGSVGGKVYAREFGIYATQILDVAAIPQADCSSYSFHANIYRKPAGASSFTFLNQVAAQGDWTTYPTPHCWPNQTTTTNVLDTEPPPSSGTDVYRVAISARLTGATRPVKATFSHLTINN